MRVTHLLMASLSGTDALSGAVAAGHTKGATGSFTDLHHLLSGN